MQPLELIKQALHSSIEYINKGDDPTKALEKVARDYKLNPNFIQRTGEALNVALHHNHFKTAADKSADFNVADIPSVTANIFSEQEKSLKQKVSEWFPAITEDIDYNKVLTNPGFKKVAQVIKNDPENYSSFDITLKGQYKKASDYLSRIDKELDALKTEKAGHDVYLEASFLNLIREFKKEASARTPFHEFESQVFATHGDRSKDFVDLIYKSANLNEERGKHDSGYLSFEPCKEAELFDSFLKCVDGISKLAAEVKEAEEFVNSQRDRYRDIGSQLNPLERAFDKAACEKLANDLDAAVEKEAGELTKSLFQDLLNKLNETAMKKDVKKPTFKNTSLDNRERTALLQEIIMTDPILSKADPRKIIAAYQQILRLAPHISKEKEVVRAQLRAAVAGQAMAAVDAKQLIETDEAYLKHHQLLRHTEGGEDKKK